MGMRGDGDLPMTDAGSAQENFRLLRKFLLTNGILLKVTGKPAKETPQIWALYSEVLEYYDQGIDIPEDMIVLFCDDNWGNVRRLPELEKSLIPVDTGFIIMLICTVLLGPINGST